MEHDASVAETHISTVFFAGDRAYKLLKPVRTGFLDFSTTALRRPACVREVELNRRLAPDVYLGVSDIVEHDVVVDHFIVMRRLPADRRLSVLAGTPEGDAAVRQVARAVAIFHSALPEDAASARCATPEAIALLWHHNFVELSAYAGTILDGDAFERCRALAASYVAGRAGLFDERVAQGQARDGHGDLLAEDIFCLADGPRILDCLAFDDDLRRGDVLLDVAFLAMDLERLAGPAMATLFLDQYDDFTNERHPRSLADHYIAYRALVRCKVACLRSAQGSPGAAADAGALLRLALAHLEAAVPRLLLVGGGPGTGKSTVSAGLSEALDCVRLSSDDRRKDLAGIEHSV
ncbi:MAG: hypothetical protein JWL70_2872, partial [Acidimicrobiia bacterium]|nr:hypothetical protein [Acidimicrobiia bacterium]